MEKRKVRVFRDKLLGRRESLVGQVQQAELYSRERDAEATQDPADMAANAYTKELLVSMSDNDRKLLNLIDEALERAGVPTDKHRWVLRSTLPTQPAGRFHGNMVVTMRWLTPDQVITATQVSARFPFNHGAPIHVGDPTKIGADLKAPLFGGAVPALPDSLMPVFWACGVTPQAAAEAAGIEFMITHAPAHSFVTDIKADLFSQP